MHYDSRMDFVVSGVGVMDKAMFLLDVVELKQPIGLLEVQETVPFPNTTTHRLLTSLEIHGLVRRNEDGLFVSGPRFGTASLSQLATPILKQLSEDTGESSQLFVRRGQQRLAIVSIESRNELRTAISLGALLTIERGSSGRLLLGDAEALRQGWTASVGERAAGTASVSAPVYDGGYVVAAVCLSGPINRLGDDPGSRHAKRVVRAAKAVERALFSSHH